MNAALAKVLADMALGAGGLVIDILQMQKANAAGEPISAEALQALQARNDALRESNRALLEAVLAGGSAPGDRPPGAPAAAGVCGLCGEPMPPGEEMFAYHGYSGPCPKPAAKSPGS